MGAELVITGGGSPLLLVVFILQPKREREWVNSQQSTASPRERKRRRRTEQSRAELFLQVFFIFIINQSITAMAASSGLCKISLLCFLAALIFSTAVAASGDHEQHLVGWLPARSGCRGTVAECLDADEEFAMDSEFGRRILAQRRYVSYGALQRNTVPCSKRGSSYYNCKSGGQANPYSRGCSAITRCRR